MIDEPIKKIELADNPSVVGLDPTYEMIPRKLAQEKTEIFGKSLKAVAEMFLEFNKKIIDAVLS